MSDEFDDDVSGWMAGDSTLSPLERQRRVAPRLMWRLYRQANETMRVQMLACLLHPLNPLSMLAIASGAFAVFIDHKPHADDPRDVGEVSRFSSDQIAALTEFVDQVDHDALERVANLFADHAMEMASSYSASVATLLRGPLPVQPSTSRSDARRST